MRKSSIDCEIRLDGGVDINATRVELTTFGPICRGRFMLGPRTRDTEDRHAIIILSDGRLLDGVFSARDGVGVFYACRKARDHEVDRNLPSDSR
jgi:hypothetical protein